MRQIRYTDLNQFKVGDEVWVTGIKTTPSGRFRYKLLPTKCKVKSISGNYLSIDPSKIYSEIPKDYILDSQYGPSEFSINKNIAKSKEEAISNFNFRVRELIEEEYDKFKRIENKLKKLFL